MDLPEPSGLVMERTLTVKWGECDPAGIIFYPTYFHYFDHSTHCLFTLVGHDMLSLRSEFGLAGPVIVDTSARFMKPVAYGDELRAIAFVSEWHSRVFKVAHRIFHGDAHVCEGYELRAWAVASDEAGNGFVAREIPEAFKQLFAG